MIRVSQERIESLILKCAGGNALTDDDLVDIGCALRQQTVAEADERIGRLTVALTQAIAELDRYVDLQNKLDYREYAETTSTLITLLRVYVEKYGLEAQPPPSPSDELRAAVEALSIDDLNDARAYFEKAYAWERPYRPGTSKIAAGQYRRYADAVAQAALILGNKAQLLRDWVAGR